MAKKPKKRGGRASQSRRPGEPRKAARGVPGRGQLVRAVGAVLRITYSTRDGVYEHRFSADAQPVMYITNRPRGRDGSRDLIIRPVRFTARGIEDALL